MNRNLLQRRQFLWCFGAGVVGAGVATTAFRNLGRTHKTSMPTSINPPARVLAAVPPAGKPLPEFQGISQWLNSPPLTAADLKGSVALVQIWTFSCINCQRTLPYITRWHRQYASQGLKVVGVHSPEFPFERDVNNIKTALVQDGISYPVAVDNDFKTWNAYDNHYWPHLFLADRQGFIRYDHVGEGAYDETEHTIRQLLG